MAARKRLARSRGNPNNPNTALVLFMVFFILLSIGLGIGIGVNVQPPSSVVSSAKSDGASDARSSRSVTLAPRSIGSPARQSLLTASVVDAVGIP